MVIIRNSLVLQLENYHPPSDTDRPWPSAAHDLHVLPSGEFIRSTGSMTIRVRRITATRDNEKLALTSLLYLLNRNAKSDTFAVLNSPAGWYVVVSYLLLISSTEQLCSWKLLAVFTSSLVDHRGDHWCFCKRCYPIKWQSWKCKTATFCLL